MPYASGDVVDSVSSSLIHMRLGGRKRQGPVFIEVHRIWVSCHTYLTEVNQRRQPLIGRRYSSDPRTRSYVRLRILQTISPNKTKHQQSSTALCDCDQRVLLKGAENILHIVFFFPCLRQEALDGMEWISRNVALVFETGKNVYNPRYLQTLSHGH